VTVDVPTDPNRISSFMMIRVADIQVCYELWKSRSRARRPAGGNAPLEGGRCSLEGREETRRRGHGAFRFLPTASCAGTRTAEIDR
jgi:hypothetical protein